MPITLIQVSHSTPAPVKLMSGPVLPEVMPFPIPPKDSAPQPKRFPSPYTPCPVLWPWIGAEPLDAEGRYMRADSVESNGPFLEAKEAITGYFLLQAKDLDEAEALARTCPVFKYGGVLELRPIMKF